MRRLAFGTAVASLVAVAPVAIAAAPLAVATAHPASGVTTPPAPRAAARAALDAASAALENGDAAGAEQQLRKLLAQAGPGTALAAHQLLARVLIAEERGDEAIAELRRAALVGPLERDLALRLAEAEQASGRPAQAARQLRSVASRFQSAQAWLTLAKLQSEQKHAAGALASIEKARALAPSSEEVLRSYAEAAFAAGSPLSAIPALETLTRLVPTVAEYQRLLGMALTKAGDSAAALDPLREAIRLEPDHRETLLALGAALDERKLYPEAKPHLLRALSLAPDDAAALAELAVAEEGLGELPQAELHARRALEKAPGTATASLVLGAIALEKERYAEARDAYVAALATAPASAKAHYQLSLAYARLGDATNADAQLLAYRHETQAAEARLAKVRALTGYSPGGMER